MASSRGVHSGHCAVTLHAASDYPASFDKRSESSEEAPAASTSWPGEPIMQQIIAGVLVTTGTGPKDR